jgi:hypothetical protein
MMTKFNGLDTGDLYDCSTMLVYFNRHLSCLFGSGYCNLEVQDLSDFSDDFEEGAIQQAIGRSLQDMEQMYASIKFIK